MRMHILFLAALLAAILASAPAGAQDGGKPMNADKTAAATFAGGCFWCTESDFEKLPGVLEVVSGYAGGAEANPSYEQVSAGTTGHLEAVRVVYDPARLSYAQLLDWFWKHVDPTDGGGQFVDRGKQYRAAIFFANDQEKALAEASRDKLAATGRFKQPIATLIVPLSSFYPAEDYHQDYYRKNPLRYKYYRYNSGRDQFLEKAWKGEEQQLPAPAPATGGEAGGAAAPGAFRKPSDAELKARLTPMQYQVTQKDGTEPPYKNEYWDNHADGVYVDVVSGEPLFSSTDKYESNTGWPSFTKPLEPGNITTREDRSLFSARTEVRSKLGDSHLGHVFPDGPPPLGLRYCMNSAALRFVPKDKLETEGLGRYLPLFAK